MLKFQWYTLNKMALKFTNNQMVLSTQLKSGSGTVVAPNEVIASMNSAGDSTTAPTKLNNVGSSIADKAGNTFLDKIDAAAADNNTKNGSCKCY